MTTLTLDHLLQFIDEEDARLNTYYGVTDETIKKLGRTVKLTEELGELCNEIMHSLSYQRADKLEPDNEDKIREELADVILTALILGKTLKVDIRKGLLEKMVKIEKRYVKQ